MVCVLPCSCYERRSPPRAPCSPGLPEVAAVGGGARSSPQARAEAEVVTSAVAKARGLVGASQRSARPVPERMPGESECHPPELAAEGSSTASTLGDAHASDQG